MTRLRRQTGAAVVLTIGAAFAAIAAPAAMAADDCPNAAVRAQQNATHLPNCMAYEKATPDDKNGAPPRAQAFSPDGSRMIFDLNGSLDDSLSYMVGRYRMTRPTDGTTEWSKSSLAPPYLKRLPILTDMPDLAGWSEDMERVLIATSYPVADNDQGQTSGRIVIGSRDLYLREPDGSSTWLVPDPGDVDTSVAEVSLVGHSRTMDRIFLSTTRRFDPRVTDESVEHVYVRTDEGMHLASILPDGSVPTSEPLGSLSYPARAVSSDGRRVVFTDTGSGDARIYVRFDPDDPDTATTREAAVGPNGETCQSAGLLALSDDGRQLMFTCFNPLVPGAPEWGTYIRDLDGGSGAVRSLGYLGVAPRVLASSDDFSRVYVEYQGVIRLLRDGEPARVVVETSTSQPPEKFFASRDGEYVAFETKFDFGLPGVDAGSPDDVQVYRYAAATDELTCVSCRQDGAPTSAAGGFSVMTPWIGSPPVDPVSDSGTVTFTTRLGLVPRDANGVLDAYAWVDGEQVLLSSGRSPVDSISIGQSADGRSLFFTTSDSLVPNDRDRSAYDTYAVRVDGGVLVPNEPAACTANCQAPALERPSLPAVGSGLVGGGNLVEETTSNAPWATASLTVARSVRGKSTSVRVKVSRAGSIRVSGAGLRQATVKAKKAGTYRVTVRLSDHGLKQQRKRGRLATKITARLTPESGASVQTRKSVTFTATKKGGR